MELHDGALLSVCLSTKFKVTASHKRISTNEACKIVNDASWDLRNWYQPRIFEVFIKEHEPLNLTDVQAYEFSDDNNNLTLLQQVKCMSLENALKSKAPKCKTQDSLFVHPSKGPFSLSLESCIRT